jgi:cyanophycinase
VETLSARPLRVVVALAALACASVRAGPGASYDAWFVGDPGDARPATRPGLLLSGGGGDVADAFRWFIGCAGGGDILVLRASGADAYQDYLYREIGGVSSVETIRFNDAAAARDPRVLGRIARADGILLAGGDQSRYVSWWKDTPVEDALNAHVRAGRPLGGWSAGLAVLGEFHFAALHASITSAEALADPFDRSVTLGTDFLALPHLAGVLTDSHFMERQRLGRLVAFLARLGAGAGERRLVGLGVDEATAACVEPDGRVLVRTARNGRVWVVRPTQPPTVLAEGRPLRVKGVEVIGLGPDSEFSLATLQVVRPVERRRVAAEQGEIKDDPLSP